MKLYSAHHRKNGGEQGYVLIVLLLMVALIAIAMGAAVTNFKKSIQRDKEVEAIHRGVQYARAIKVYYRKFGHYPTSVDQLVNTNNLRFLRRKYADPLSPDGKWRVLHQQDVKLFGTGGGLGLTPSSGMPNIPGVSGGGNTVLGSGGTSNSGSGFNLFGNNSQNSASTNQSDSASQGGPGSTSQPIGGAVETVGGTDSGSSGSSSGSSSSGSVFSNGQNVMGGGPILGVASLRNENGIHSFNQKTNYRDWQFIFNPQTDMDRQITGPYNPNAFFGKQASNPMGNPGSNSQNTVGAPFTPQQPQSTPQQQPTTPQQ